MFRKSRPNIINTLCFSNHLDKICVPEFLLTFPKSFQTTAPHQIFDYFPITWFKNYLKWLFHWVGPLEGIFGFISPKILLIFPKTPIWNSTIKKKKDSQAKFSKILFGDHKHAIFFRITSSTSIYQNFLWIFRELFQKNFNIHPRLSNFWLFFDHLWKLPKKIFFYAKF